MYEKMELEFFHQNGFSSDCIDGICHTKTLSFLSVVQAQKGHYGIALNGGAMEDTGEGGFFIAPANATQKIVHNADKASGVMTARWVFLKVKMDDAYFLDGIYNFPVILPKSRNAEMNAVFDEAFADGATLCDRYIAYYKIIKILLSVATESDSKTDPRLLATFVFVKNNCRKNVTVADMAENVSMSEANFYKFFKRHTGYTPVRYLNNYRLSLASSLLLSTDESIKSISESVGINDSVYFNKLFKRNYQMPPSVYREVYKKG